MTIKTRLKKSLFLKVFLIVLSAIILWINFSILSFIILAIEPLKFENTVTYGFSEVFNLIKNFIPILAVIISLIICFGKNATESFFIFSITIFFSLWIALSIFDQKQETISSFINQNFTKQDTISLAKTDTTTIKIDTNYVAFTPPQSVKINDIASIDYGIIEFASFYAFKFFKMFLKFQLMIFSFLSTIFGLVLFLRYIKNLKTIQ